MNRYQMLINAMHTILHTSEDEKAKGVALRALLEAKEIIPGKPG